MNTLEAIRTRRSIRAYQRKAIAPEALKEMVTAAMYAPSAMDQQAWQFLIIDQPALLKRVSELQPNAQMASGAAAAILVCGDTRLETVPGMWVQDCSAATQNLMLAAHDMGIGTVWTAAYPDVERIKRFQVMFRMPPEVIPLALVVMGYPVEKPEARQRFRADRVHQNTW